MKTLPNDSKMRYHYPISSGCIAYFPAALAGVAKHSYIGGAKYNNGALVHLRYVSTEHMDCIGRHVFDLQDLLAAHARGETSVEAYVWDFVEGKEMLRNIPIHEAILIECNALSWRSLALSQELHEKLAGKPLAPAARLTPNDAEAKPITLLSFGRNKVAVVKALREIKGYTLKEAIDIVNNLPHFVDYNSQWTREKAVAQLVAAGATVS